MCGQEGELEGVFIAVEHRVVVLVLQVEVQCENQCFPMLLLVHHQLTALLLTRGGMSSIKHLQNPRIRTEPTHRPQCKGHRNQIKGPDLCKFPPNYIPHGPVLLEPPKIRPEYGSVVLVFMTIEEVSRIFDGKVIRVEEKNVPESR